MLIPRMFFCVPSNLDLNHFKKDWGADRQAAYVLETRIARLCKAQTVSCQMHVIEWVLERARGFRAKQVIG